MNRGSWLAYAAGLTTRLIVLLCALAPLAPAQLKGLQAPAKILWDANSVPHILAENDHDAMLLLGYVHARDRFFQMDYQRREVSGRAAELLGRGALSSDIQIRTLGVRRAAEASREACSAETLALLEAYAQGVNAWLQDPNTTLPPEYGALELTKASVPAWDPVDSIAIAKGLAFDLSFGEDMSLTLTLSACQQAGQRYGFDGTALFFDDLYRSAPFDPAVSIPGFLAPPPAASSLKQPRRSLVEAARSLPGVLLPSTLKLARKYLDTLRQIPRFDAILNRAESGAGSNWWVVSGSRTGTGNAMLASDPHLSLSTPAVWYEAHLTVPNDPARGPMNVTGVSLPGTPGVVLGCNDRVCWGATTNPMDVTDTYQERLLIDLATFIPVATVFDGQAEPLVLIPQTYRLNQVGNKVADDLVDARVGFADGGLTLLAPRRNYGPILAFDFSNPFNITGLSLQYTGWGPTRELETFLGFSRAQGLEDFKRALRFFSVGSQNWAYADVEGNIAYFTSAALPLREDLQTLGRVDGLPPFLIRDGTHRFKNEWLPLSKPQPEQTVPYEILPFDEMPQVVNPAQGFIVNTNNDPVGVTLDNNPLGRPRPGGGIYYLSPGYEGGFRVGRITGLIQERLAAGGKITIEDLQRFQANNQMLDAEKLTPHLQAAFANAPAAFAGDAGVAEAVRRLSEWDFSTPTGIREGFDPGDDPANLAEPSEREVSNSVAATIYSVWRGQVLRNTIDAALLRAGLGSHLPPSDQSLAALRNLLDNFASSKGRGVSGVNFFQVDGAPTPEAARDTLILKSLRDALDLVASDAFAAAFNKSRDQNDYRWGKLHRIVFRHELGGQFNVPPAGGFSNLAPNLAGLARAGGFGVLDASSHSVRAAGLNSFTFGGGPSRRFVAELSPGGIKALQAIPGGQSGLLDSPAYANLLGSWLTNAYHPLWFTPGQVNAARASEEQFVP